MLGSWNRDQLARTFSSDDGDIVQTWSTLTASLMRNRKLPVGIDAVDLAGPVAAVSRRGCCASSGTKNRCLSVRS